MNYGLLLYLKLARVDVGNVSKKGKNMEGIFFWLLPSSWVSSPVWKVLLLEVFLLVGFLTELCLFMSGRVYTLPQIAIFKHN